MPDNDGDTKLAVPQALPHCLQLRSYYKAATGIPPPKKNDYGRISSGHITPFGNSQDIILFHLIVSL